MLTNSEMKAGRFYDMHHSRIKKAEMLELYNKIQAHFAAGGEIIVATYTKATHFKPKHSAMIQMRGSSLYMQRGKHWDCIDYCIFRFSVLQ